MAGLFVTMKNYWKHIITFAVLAVCAVLILILNGAFNKTGAGFCMEMSDALFVPGALAICVGLLIFADNGGTFDMLSYGVISLIDLFRKDVNNRKYKTFYDYRESRKGTNKPFGYLLLWGGIFVVVGVVFLFIK